MARKSRKQQVPNASNAQPIEHKPTKQTQTHKGRIWKAAVYVRLSIEKRTMEQTRASLKSQEQVIYDMLKSHDDIKVVDSYVDCGYSGTNFERPEFKRMMADAYEGVIDCIVVKDLSRFGRSHLDVSIYLEQLLPNIGVRFIALADNVDTLSKDRGHEELIVPIKNIVNEMYSRDLSRKIKATRRTQIEKGQGSIFNAPFGYKKDPDLKHHLLIDEPAAKIVRQIYNEYIGGKSSLQIARQLTSDNIPSPNMVLKGKRIKMEDFVQKSRWNAESVLKILKEDVYIGVIRYNKYDNSKFNNKSGPTRRPEEEHLVFADAHEPIVTREIFEKAKAITASRVAKQDKSNNRTKTERPLTESMFAPGIVKCAECGKGMILSRDRTSNTGDICSVSYHCRGAAKNHKDGMRATISEPYLLIVVADAIRAQIEIRQRFSLASGSRESIKLNEKLKGTQAKIKAKTFDIEMLEEKRMKLYEDKARCTISTKDWQEMKLQTDAFLKDLRTELDGLKSEEADILELLNADEHFDAHVGSNADLSMPDITKDLISSFVNEVRVGKDKTIEIDFKCNDYTRHISAARRLGL
jgi:DNA invertase Pin-like site-specific DNA recombinase